MKEMFKEELRKIREESMIGKVSKLLAKGETPREIAIELDQPIEQINKWIELIEESKKILNS